MNEEMEISPASQPLAYKDQSVWLTIFGVLTILLGGVCLLFIPLMIFATMSAHTEGGVPRLLPTIGMYGAAGIGLIGCGIGSILARRWARALLLIFSWSWLAMGTVAILSMAILFPFLIHDRIRHPNGLSHGEYIAFAVAGSFLLVVFVVIPAIWVSFYGRKSIKVTCEARNPLPSWTDACPLPVLAASLFLGLTILSYLANIFSYRIIPFFGVFLTGIPAILGCIIIIAICVTAALGLYRLDRRAWWLLVVTMALLFLSNAVTYWFHSLREFYQLMGYSEQQLRPVQNPAALKSHAMAWISLAIALPTIGYILFIGRYFKGAKGGLAAQSQPRGK